jgi:hypothetical protein
MFNFPKLPSCGRSVWSLSSSKASCILRSSSLHVCSRFIPTKLAYLFSPVYLSNALASASAQNILRFCHWGRYLFLRGQGECRTAPGAEQVLAFSSAVAIGRRLCSACDKLQSQARRDHVISHHLQWDLMLFAAHE